MKLLFLDCDSTLSAIEGIDALAALRGPKVEAEVVALTNDAMNGDVPIEDIFSRRLELIQPTRELCAQVGQLYIEHTAPGIQDALAEARSMGWTPIIISGGFTAPIEPFAKFLDIEEIHAVSLFFNDDGSYQGFDKDAPTARNGGKPDIIQAIKAQRSPLATAMVGDGVSDLETQAVVDIFVGFGGFTPRPAVKDKAMTFISAFHELSSLLKSVTHPEK